MSRGMIEINNLSMDYGERAVLQNFSLEVALGEIVILLGESGCGKTTLLRILAGFEQESEGQVFLKGRRMDSNIAPNQRELAMVFQEPTLWNHMSVLKNITYGMKGKNPAKVAEIMNALEIHGLENRYPEELSGGQAKRVALARALAADREILLLDEPLSNIDIETKKKIAAFIDKNYKGKKTILYVTHSKWEADFFNCRQIRMDAGEKECDERES